MRRRPPISTRPDTLLPSTTLFRSYHLLILDDLAYVAKDQAETSVLFELISARYECRSMLITANQPFGEWNRVFPDPAMTLAAVRSEEHTSELQSLMRISYAVFCLKKKTKTTIYHSP